MQLLGILMGLIMVGSFFLEWEVAKVGSIVLKVNYFLGVSHNALFSIRGLHMDFVPVVLALVLILMMALAKIKGARITSLLASFLCLAVAARDIRHVMRLKDVLVGPGLWVFAAASIIALIVAILLLPLKRAPKPEAPPSAPAP